MLSLLLNNSKTTYLLSVGGFNIPSSSIDFLQTGAYTIDLRGTVTRIDYK